MFSLSFISSNFFDAEVAHIIQCKDLVRYAVSKLKELKKQIGLDLRIMNCPPSLSILFMTPNTHIMLKFSLLTLPLVIDSKQLNFAQLYIMRHITTDKIDSFIKDLESPGAFQSSQ